MIELIYHRGKMLLPENFEELNGKQFIELAYILFTGGDELKCKVKALKILSGFSHFKFLLLKVEVINNALQFVDWVFDKEKNITKQLLPCYKNYYGPASGFDNLRMKEFHLSELYYREMAPSKSPPVGETSDDSDKIEDALNNLVAVLYRPGKKGYDVKRDKDGDIRIDFNHNELPYYAKRVARWPLKIKQAIFLWYAGCRKELEDNNPLVFKEEGGDFHSQFDTGLYGVMCSLAGDKLGPVDKIENMYVHTAMVNIGMIKEEEKYFEEKMKKAG